MNKPRSSRRRGFLEEYRLDETYLLKPDRATGRPGILEGLAPDGEPVLVKTWPRNSKQNEEDLAEIWRHELRQLHRLYGYPGAADLIAPLRATSSDDRGFYLVLDPANRRPLDEDSDEAGHAFQYEAGRHSDLKPATQRSLPRIEAIMFRRGEQVKPAEFLTPRGQ